MKRSAEARYGRNTMATAKRLGISPWEAAAYNVEFRHDEHVEHHRQGPKSLMPEWARELAKAMIDQAHADYRQYRLVRPDYIPPDYRPDPEGARQWFLSDEDHALSFIWCAQVLNIPEDAIRRHVFQDSPLRERNGA